MRVFKKLRFAAPLILLSFCCVSCGGNKITPREEGALVTGAVGAAAGAVVGSQFGETGAGAAIGAGSGAVAGAIAGDGRERSYEEQVEVQKEIIRKQEALIKRQSEEIQDLRRQMYYNDGLKRYDGK